MKSILNDKKVKVAKKYPYIGIYTESNEIIVLFTKKNTGVVIHRKGEEDLIEHNTTWNEDGFSYLYGYSVSLSN